MILLASPNSQTDLHGHHEDELLEVNGAAVVLINDFDETVDL
jgi:hypothetical protein